MSALVCPASEGSFTGSDGHQSHTQPTTGYHTKSYRSSEYICKHRDNRCFLLAWEYSYQNIFQLPEEDAGIRYLNIVPSTAYAMKGY